MFGDARGRARSCTSSRRQLNAAAEQARAIHPRGRLTQWFSVPSALTYMAQPTPSATATSPRSAAALVRRGAADADLITGCSGCRTRVHQSLRPDRGHDREQLLHRPGIPATTPSRSDRRGCEGEELLVLDDGCRPPRRARRRPLHRRRRLSPATGATGEDGRGVRRDPREPDGGSTGPATSRVSATTASSARAVPTPRSRAAAIASSWARSRRPSRARRRSRLGGRPGARAAASKGRDRLRVLTRVWRSPRRPPRHSSSRRSPGTCSPPGGSRSTHCPRTRTGRSIDRMLRAMFERARTAYARSRPRRVPALRRGGR